MQREGQHESWQDQTANSGDGQARQQPTWMRSGKAPWESPSCVRKELGPWALPCKKAMAGGREPDPAKKLSLWWGYKEKLWACPTPLSSKGQCGWGSLKEFQWSFPRSWKVHMGGLSPSEQNTCLTSSPAPLLSGGAAVPWPQTRVGRYEARFGPGTGEGQVSFLAIFGFGHWLPGSEKASKSVSSWLCTFLGTSVGEGWTWCSACHGVASLPFLCSWQEIYQSLTLTQPMSGTWSSRGFRHTCPLTKHHSDITSLIYPPLFSVTVSWKRPLAELYGIHV